MKRSLAEIMKNEGYIKHYEYIKDETGNLRLYMKYGNKRKVLTGLKRISKPGKGLCEKDEIPRVLGGLGCCNFHIQWPNDNKQAERKERAAK